MKSFYMYEYYIKGLDIRDQRVIAEKLDNKFTVGDRNNIADEVNDFKNVKASLLYKLMPDAFDRCLERYTKVFTDLNEMMIECKRLPFFENPTKLIESLEKYDQLNEFKTEEEWKKFFGSSYDEYKPLKSLNIREKTKQNGD